MKYKKTNLYCLFKTLSLQIVSCIYDFNILLKTEVYLKKDILYILEPKWKSMPFAKQFDLKSKSSKSLL